MLLPDDTLFMKKTEMRRMASGLNLCKVGQLDHKIDGSVWTLTHWGRVTPYEWYGVQVLANIN